MDNKFLFGSDHTIKQASHSQIIPNMLAPKDDTLIISVIFSLRNDLTAPKSKKMVFCMENLWQTNHDSLLDLGPKQENHALP